MPDDAPIDALDSAVIAISQLLDAIAAELGPVPPLDDAAPAPLWPEQLAA